MYDIIIIGAGPAGISAGIYAVSRGKRTLILEKAQVGGIIGKVSTVTHYTAIEKQETGATFAARMKEQALQAGVEIVQAEAVHVALTGEVKSVTTDRGIYEAKRIILANGGTPRKLGIPGEKELAGKGMGMNAARDGAAYAGKNVYVVGGADGAVKEALYLAGYAKQVTVIHFEEQLGCIAEFRQKVAAAGNISVRLASRLHAVYGQDQVERLEIAKRFGATELLLPDTLALKQRSADVVIDYSGRVASMEAGVELLAIGGTAVWVGGVCPQERVKIDSEQLIRRLGTIKGLHNYNLEDFKEAVAFISHHWQDYPIAELVCDKFTLEEADEAFQYAIAHNPYRVGIRMNP